jgi:NAD(P)-dependent dehydrogenase (short-subunit alcohol dehydrogenase family)
MSGKTAILTGAAGGIGRATAEKLAAAGWSLVLVDAVEAVNDVAASLRKNDGQSFIGVVANLGDEVAPDRIAEGVARIGQPLKGLALVAGVLQQVGSIETIELAEWDRVMNINLRVNLVLMKRFIPALREAGDAAIVTVSSWYGKSGHGFFSAYCASKAGLISLTHSAAAELAHDKVRVNTVAPGNVATGMHINALKEEAEKRSTTFEQMKKIEWDKIPLERAAEPSEIANAIKFLLSPESSYITGATIDVNGGCLFS